MLTIDKITATIKESGKEVLKDFSLTIKEGEIHAIMGPNGVGKSTLSKVIMAHPSYCLKKGSISFLGEDLLPLTTDERARRGIFYLMQDPVSIDGVTNSECLRTALAQKQEEAVNLYTFIKSMNHAMDQLHMPKDMMHRSLNQGFSGGEKKKNEVLQLTILEPKLIILDELDSGLDVDSLKIVCDHLNHYLQEHPKTGVLMITHYSRILDLIKPTYVHQMIEGTIIKTGPATLAKEIEKSGYHGINEVSKDVANE